ncbi:hypothetical protein [Bradyrhizobium liaoningense]|uniref:hypothetical protein n=1 Tax=Bradyrhizobium liaoningense TaxID=43992 RepID=UPI001BA88CE8|nr:hypothetical protein [Bradyrhizobium liaoningense]MBR0821807.1 hypothetical protein [Bradyrhizobium liaoningense]
MRRFLIRLLIFGLLGPAVIYASIYLTVRTAERWWWPQPSIYWVELTPFLLSAFVDGALQNLSASQRLVFTASATFMASDLACALAYGGFGAWMFGLYTPVIAAVCSVVASGTDIEDGGFIGD